MTSFLGVGSKAGKIVYAEDIECVVDPVNGIGGIFIGNLEASQNLATLRRHSIKAVLTAASGACLSHPKSQVPLYKYIPGEDHQRFDLSKYFDECVQFIDTALQQTNILVHCMAGVSRSVSLVLAYLIKHKDMRYEEAYSHVKSRRKIVHSSIIQIHPNDGFIDQLKKYERQVKSLSPAKARYESPYRKSESPVKRFADYDSPSKRREELFPSTAYLESNSRLAVSPSKLYAGSPARRSYESPVRAYESPAKNYESPLKHSEAFERSGLAATLNPEKRMLKEYINESRVEPPLFSTPSRNFLPGGASTILSKHSSSVSHYRGRSEVENNPKPDSDLDKKIADIRKKYSDLSQNVKSRFTEENSSAGSAHYFAAGPPLRHMKSMNYDHHAEYPSAVFLRSQMDNYMQPSTSETPAPRLHLRRQATMYERPGFGGNFPTSEHD